MSIFQQRSLDATGNPGGPAHRFVMSATAQFDRWFINAWFGWPSERMGVLLFLKKGIYYCPSYAQIRHRRQETRSGVAHTFCLASRCTSRGVWTNQLLGVGGRSPIFLSVYPCVRLRIFYRSMATFSTRHTCR
jgi:hypothetical protein